MYSLKFQEVVAISQIWEASWAPLLSLFRWPCRWSLKDQRPTQFRYLSVFLELPKPHTLFFLLSPQNCAQTIHYSLKLGKMREKRSLFPFSQQKQPWNTDQYHSIGVSKPYFSLFSATYPLSLCTLERNNPNSPMSSHKGSYSSLP